MTVVNRRPWCEGCKGTVAWGACSTYRPRRHRHGSLPSTESCDLWVCWRCRRPSRLVYLQRLARAATQRPRADVRLVDA